MLQHQTFDIQSLHRAYAEGITPQRVIAECERRINQADDPGIFISRLTPQQIDIQLNALGSFDTKARPLWGIPFVIKDNIDAEGCETTVACPAYAYSADQDAVAVSLLKQAGAILLGKTNLDQFATGLVGLRTPYPAPLNALDPEIVPGGSSSGSATAVARGLVSFSLGTDTAGSGRVPAALNGIVGLKPSVGAVSLGGVVPACQTLDTVSIFGLMVEDAYRVFRTISQFDHNDPASRSFRFQPTLCLSPHFTVAVPNRKSLRFFDDSLQAESFDNSLEQLRTLGAQIEEIDFTPFYQVAELLYQGAWVAERYSVVESLLKESPEVLHPITRQVIQFAETLSSVDVFRDFYRLSELRLEVQPQLDSFDLLCVPSIPTFYRVSDVEQDPFGPNSRLGTYTNFVNLLDLCGITVPVHPRSDGRPGSVTLLAKSGQDSLTASVAERLQQLCSPPMGATEWPLPKIEPGQEPDIGDDEIALAVVGAHMSGLPLNHELSSRGGRFLMATHTAAQYRLYSLSGGPPFRPGLVRDRSGKSIALEVWKLPKQNFGDFIAGVPMPLAIGTAILADGSQVKSFVCESIGLEGALDITRFGGWRTYLDSKS